MNREQLIKNIESTFSKLEHSRTVVMEHGVRFYFTNKSIYTQYTKPVEFGYYLLTNDQLDYMIEIEEDGLDPDALLWAQMVFTYGSNFMEGWAFDNITDLWDTDHNPSPDINEIFDKMWDYMEHRYAPSCEDYDY